MILMICYSQELHVALKQAQADLDKQRRELNEKKDALQGLKKDSSEREAELLSEVKRLKEQALKDRAELDKALEKAKEVTVQTRERQSKVTSNVQPHGVPPPCPLVSAGRKDGGGAQQQPGATGSKRSPQREAGPHGTSHTAAHTGKVILAVTQKRRPPTHALFSNKRWKLTKD